LRRIADRLEELLALDKKARQVLDRRSGRTSCLYPGTVIEGILTLQDQCDKWESTSIRHRGLADDEVRIAKAELAAALERAEIAESDLSISREELDSMRAARAKDITIITDALHENDALRADAERMDWLDKEFANTTGRWFDWPTPGSLRAAIDAAIAKGGA
jgi:hypothetical protein